jgi:hypothetical protein
LRNLLQAVDGQRVAGHGRQCLADCFGWGTDRSCLRRGDCGYWYCGYGGRWLSGHGGYWGLCWRSAHGLSHRRCHSFNRAGHLCDGGSGSFLAGLRRGCRCGLGR